MNGTLLLDLSTIATAPKFFSLVALVERSAGRKIVVMGQLPVDKIETLAASYGVAFQQSVRIFGEQDGYSHPHQQKLDLARTLSVDGPVIWIDVDLDNWKGPSVGGYEKLVTLNWKAVLRQGTAPIAEKV